MPHGEAHKRQRAKNYLTLAILLGLAALFFAATVIKITGK